MLRNLILGSVLLMLSSYPAFSQTMETVSVSISDQKDELITIGIVTITDSTGKEIASLDLEQASKIPVLNVGAGNYTLEVQSPGFKTYQKKIEVKKGKNDVEVKLELEDIKANVDVIVSQREKRLDEVMGGYLSQAEIDSLPENGEDIKEELQKRYGDDILIRIDGDFEGSQIPSKSEISSIKVIRNTFDSEFHEIGRIIVDIRTGFVSTKFHVFGNFSLNNSNLNARDPFAFKRQPARANNLLLVLSGPVIKNKTSFSFSTVVFNRLRTQNFIGAGIIGNNSKSQQAESWVSVNSFSIKHLLSKNHTLNFRYQNTQTKFKNLGLGAFDLPSRGSNLNNIQHKFSLIESGTFKQKYFNDFTFDFTRGSEKITPNSEKQTIYVLSAFNLGGSGMKSRIDKYRFRLADNLLFDTKNHSLKLGTEIEYEKLRSISENNLNGTFTFLNLTDFNNGKPTQFSQTTGKTEYGLNQLRTAVYFQDYFKIKKALQLSLGIRHEWQNDVNDVSNFSPRVGYVWSPEKSGKFIFRGGTGVFYDWLETSLRSTILSNDGRQGQKIIIRNPNFPNPFINGTVSQTLLFNISKLADKLVTPSIFITQNGFNYKLDKSLTFEGIYTFRKGTHLFRSRNTNAPVNGVRPNQNLGVTQLLESSGTLQENSFELKINGYYKGINIYANYELSKNISDFSSALSLPANNYDLQSERGLSSQDQTHKLNVSFNFDLFEKKINVSPSFRLESGFPYNITTGKDDNNDTIFNDRPLGISRNSERGEFLKQVDLRVRWKMPVRYLGLKEDKRKSLSLNLNARNLLNTTNLINYVGIQTSPYFKQATSANTARSVELGLSFGF